MIESLPAPLAPITELDVVHIVGWYFVFYFLAATISGVLSQIYDRINTVVMEKEVDFSLRKVIFAGPLEEMTFRGTAAALAIYVFEFGDLGIFVSLMIANGIWAGMHKHRFGTFIFTFVFGLYLTKFWLNGFEGLWWMAIVMHSGHNILVTILGEYVFTEEQEMDPRRTPKKSST